MTNILLDISGKFEKQTVGTLMAVKAVADELHIPLFVVGATARDIIIEYYYGIKAPRATLDVDVGVRVESWEMYKRLTNKLLKRGFVSTQQQQRYRFKSTLVDIIPFGPISDSNSKIAWPPENDIIMSTLGFDEVYSHAVTVIISNDPTLEAKVSSIAGMAILKLIAWDEKYPGRNKDAKDLLFLMKKYEITGTDDRLYDLEQELLKEEKFDVSSASIRLLGRDIMKIADRRTGEKIREIVSREADSDQGQRLLLAMSGTEDDYEESFKILDKFRQGVFDSL